MSISSGWFFWPQGPCFLFVDGNTLVNWVQEDWVHDNEYGNLPLSQHELYDQLMEHLNAVILKEVVSKRSERVRIFNYPCIKVPEEFCPLLDAMDLPQNENPYP